MQCLSIITFSLYSVVLLSFLSLYPGISSAVESISGNESLSGSQKLTSKGGLFELELLTKRQTPGSPGAILGLNGFFGQSLRLVSWKDEDDPAAGLFELQPDQILSNQLSIVWNRSKVFWSSGVWNGQHFTNIPEMTENSFYELTYVTNYQKTYVAYKIMDDSIAREEEYAQDRSSKSEKDQTPTAQVAVLVSELISKGSSLEFSMFHFASIIKATDNFSAANKIGEGGFGPVYKGHLQEGEEIAVKRLAARSGQGLEEFMNEIMVIAKLQHQNLVKLLGCCVEGEEKILVYEYMPNQSLDFFLFDAIRKQQLDWNKRCIIIDGIAQGLLYLHKYSRVRIIHRDLKASNILLDSDMNPKISDFGMARIFGTNTAHASTNRIVGTYGYMPPEYAMEGLFSVKSDVFSFGVLLLEIISGQRNTTFHKYGKALNLLSHAWELWKEGKLLDILDPCLADKIPTSEASKCIVVALLCVQENASDRPTMLQVVAMLGSENATLINPKKPAFFTAESEGAAEVRTVGFSSVNDITFTALEGR
ncbi:hypothetical protein HPP92_013659 [Vanilla planifolia]|uniref:non-specific serine/threonine protein kinase n=1 Tax=Vanilla planifolia TaxID=51239 RepID=A0A835QSP3_VANPL|nr:hypothetical protein HPP92_013659 [Vanilla planifolia]